MVPVKRSARFTFLSVAAIVAVQTLCTPHAVSAQASLDVVYAFTGGDDGGNPYAGVVQGTDGNLYGTTQRDTVFVTGPDGTTTTLHAFTDATGAANPRALIQASDANLYGMTSSGGTFGYGQIFMLALDGTLTVLYAFNNGPEGVAPFASLLEASDGNFYGTTTTGNGPLNNGGAVFKITPDGTLTTLHQFPSGTMDGKYPHGTLIQATDGCLYGTTEAGGAFDRGTIFRMTLDGTVTIVHAFSGVDGALPFAGVIQASDGNLYGTALGGGSVDDGTAFMMTLDGASFVRLHTFAKDADGSAPISALLEASDGNFYGTTQSGGSGGAGTAFQITPTGDFSVVYPFTAGADGGIPEGALVQGPDGSFYGTAFTGGDGFVGVVFRLTLPSEQRAEPTL